MCPETVHALRKYGNSILLKVTNPWLAEAAGGSGTTTPVRIRGCRHTGAASTSANHHESATLPRALGDAEGRSRPTVHLARGGAGCVRVRWPATMTEQGPHAATETHPTTGDLPRLGGPRQLNA